MYLTLWPQLCSLSLHMPEYVTRFIQASLCKIQGLFKALECFSSTFQGIFSVQESCKFKYFSSLCEPCVIFLYTGKCYIGTLANSDDPVPFVKFRERSNIII